MDSLPPQIEQIKDYSLVGIAFWLVGKFGQRLLDFMLDRLGLNTDRRNTSEDNLRTQVETMRIDIEKLRVEVGVLRKQKDVAGDVGKALIERMKEIDLHDVGLIFLAEMLIKFSQEGDDEDDSQKKPA